MSLIGHLTLLKFKFQVQFFEASKPYQIMHVSMQQIQKFIGIKE